LAGQISPGCPSHELRRLHLAQEFGRIAADALVVDLGDLYLAIGRHEEGAAVGQPFRLDVHAKGPGQDARGIAQHGEAHGADRLAGVVPGLVREMRVGGDRIDLHAQGAQRVVVPGQILQLGRADEGEVRGVEEEDRPPSTDVLVGDGDEGLFVEGLEGEGGQGGVDDRHERISWCGRGCAGDGRIIAPGPRHHRRRGFLSDSPGLSQPTPWDGRP
jgi:hypothetical protein